jgi:ribosomal protein L37AE/L43A
VNSEYISGYTSRIDYCPFCGAEISTRICDGTSKCDNCGKRFGVVEVDD